MPTPADTTTSTRLITPDDGAELTELMIANREFLAPWQPTAPDWLFSESGTRRLIDELLESREAGTLVPHVILEGERIVGRITLSGIVHFAFQSATIGYWVAQAANGCGHATAATRLMCQVAFEELGLHRLEAGTLMHNHGSQRVLEKNGFVRFGTAPRYLKIAGKWQDHVLFQRLNERE